MALSRLVLCSDARVHVLGPQILNDGLKRVLASDTNADPQHLQRAYVTAVTSESNVDGALVLGYSLVLHSACVKVCVLWC